MSESGPTHTDPGRSFRESPEAQRSTLGNSFADPRLSATVMADANEGSRNKRRPWLWALAWVGGFAGAVAILILIVR
jgi:hypothetical protein